MAVRVPVDTDTWWHLRSGAWTLQNGFIYEDPFSHTFDGEAWINHSWGAQLVLLAFWSMAGNIGLSLYTALLAVGGMLMLWPISSGNVYIRAFVLVIGAAAAAVFWSARPQMFSFFFSTVVLFLVYRARQGGPDRLLWLIPLMWVWANLHAGYSIGYLFLFAFLVGDGLNLLLGLREHRLSGAQWRKLLFVALASIPLLALTPYGINTLLVPFQTVGIDELRQFIQEWNSPNFQGRETWPFIALVMLLFLGLWGSRLSFDWASYFLLIGTLFLALLYGRNISVFAVVAVPVLTAHFDEIMTRMGWVINEGRRFPPRMARLNAGLVLVIWLVVGVYAAGVLLPMSVADVQADALPVQAVDFIMSNELPHEMFNSYNWGGYLMFAAPQYPVFIDGRTDLYGAFLTTYLRTATAADGWRDTLAAYGVNLVMVEATSGLDNALREEDGWRLAYEDEQAVVHERIDRMTITEGPADG